VAQQNGEKTQAMTASGVSGWAVDATAVPNCMRYAKSIFNNISRQIVKFLESHRCRFYGLPGGTVDEYEAHRCEHEIDMTETATPDRSKEIDPVPLALGDP
jgi:hypothetical protein